MKSNFDFEFFKQLTEGFGPSGAEDEVRDLIASRIRGHVSHLFTDPLGNLIAVKGKGGVTFSAHMDEVAFMVTGFRQDGTLLFDQVGVIVAKNLPAKRVYFPQKNLSGVIGAVPVHLRKVKSDNVTFSDLYLDIGARSETEARALLELGDLAVFSTETRFFDRDGGLVVGKAVDDRLGCYLLCELIVSELVENGTFVFTVQEENGLLGATGALTRLSPRCGVAVDVTTPNDLPGVTGPKMVCRLKGGPVISFADGRTLYDRDSVREVFDLLKKEGIPCQTKAMRTGGNESYCFQNDPAGGIVISLSVPCRYIHAPIGLLTLEDIQSSFRALLHIAKLLEGKEKNHA